MSKMIIEEHCHGSLSVENRALKNLQKGACFTIEFLSKADDLK